MFVWFFDDSGLGPWRHVSQKRHNMINQSKTVDSSSNLASSWWRQNSRSFSNLGHGPRSFKPWRIKVEKIKLLSTYRAAKWTRSNLRSCVRNYVISPLVFFLFTQNCSNINGLVNCKLFSTLKCCKHWFDWLRSLTWTKLAQRTHTLQ